MITRRERILRSIDFKPVDRIPRTFAYPTSTFSKYGDKLIKIASKYPSDIIFWSDNSAFRPKNGSSFKKDDYTFTWSEPWITIPNFNPDEFTLMTSPSYKKGFFKDNWGCVWENIEEGLQGIIKASPLSDWSKLESYKPPDPNYYQEWGRIDWEAVKNSLKGLRETEFLLGAPVRLWERLHFLRGYSNAMMDVSEEKDELKHLLDIITDYNIKFINNWLETGVDGIGFSDDWGSQDSLMINPNQWRKIFKPYYKKMFDAVRSKGKNVFFHSDGKIIDIIPDLIEVGVNILNLQIELNGIDNIKEHCLGKICINFQADRQRILPSANPEGVKAYLREVSRNLSLDYSGCLLECWFMPDVPLENIKAAYEQTEKLVGELG